MVLANPVYVPRMSVHTPAWKVAHKQVCVNACTPAWSEICTGLCVLNECPHSPGGLQAHVCCQCVHTLGQKFAQAFVF